MTETQTTCAGCGMELSGGARFCRRCGRPSPYLNETSVTESTTQILPRPGALPIDAAAAAPLAPAYQAPLQAEHSTGATTRSLEANDLASNVKRRSPWMAYMLALLIVVATVSMIALVKWQSQTQKIVIVRQPADFMAEPPGLPHIEAPEVPSMPSAPSAPESLKSADALVYPNAHITMNIDRAGKGRVLQLSTTDEINKVADWYTNKLKPTRVVRDGGSNVVLEADRIKVVITASGNKTDVLLNQTAAR